MESLSHQTLPIGAFKQRKLIVISDGLGEHFRGVLVASAEAITAELVNEMVSLGGGLLFVALSTQRSNAFLLSKMPRATQPAPLNNGSAPTLDMCVSVEAREGVSTGISASDRATTVRILGDTPNPRKLVQPGHIFPMVVRDGGVLVKNSLPEAALDIVTIAGYSDAAAFIDLLDENGEFLSHSALENLCSGHALPHISLSQLVRYRLETEKLVHCVAEAKLPTQLAGELRSCIYRSSIHGGEHLALIKGEINPEVPILTRVQPEFTFADVFGGSTPPTRAQLQAALTAIGQKGRGILVYLRRSKTGELRNQVNAWDTKFQEKPGAFMREYGIGAQILRDLGVRKIELLSGTKKNLAGIKTFGIEIVSQHQLLLTEEDESQWQPLLSQM